MFISYLFSKSSYIKFIGTISVFVLVLSLMTKMAFEIIHGFSQKYQGISYNICYCKNISFLSKEKGS